MIAQKVTKDAGANQIFERLIDFILPVVVYLGIAFD
jgi:hypothetical protein